MVPSEQLTEDCREPLALPAIPPGSAIPPSPWEVAHPEAERAARVALRRQVERLERELSELVARRFPHIGAGAPVGRCSGPRLLSLAELECERDRLALRVRAARNRCAQREELEHDARELLQRMRAEPARYKLVRLPVAALGERGCGVWEVRPRLGLIGMLAGWWELKLSSGCPLAEGSHRRATPAGATPQARRGACSERDRGVCRAAPAPGVGRAPSVYRSRCGGPRRALVATSSADQQRFALTTRASWR